MKTFITFLFFSLAIIAKAQIVNIPDANFKYLLINLGIDLNNDGEIQVSEALAVTQLSIRETPDTSHVITNTTGLKEFKNLERLTHICRSPIMDISGLTKLTYLEFYGYYNGFLYTTSVDISGCTSLESFYASTQLTSLNMNGCNRLKFLRCDGNVIRNFNPGHLDSLERIDMMGSTNDTVDLTGCPKIKFVDWQNSTARYINLSGLKELDSSINFFLYAVENINMKNCSSVKVIQSNPLVNSLKSLDVSGCFSLTGLYLFKTRISSLHLESCHNLRDFYFYGHNDTDTSKLKYLNLKNGSLLLRTSITVADSANICADEFEIDILKSTIVSTAGAFFFGNRSIFSINPYCSNIPGGSYNIVKGQTRFDSNNNGCDRTDSALAYIPLRMTDTSGNVAVNYSESSGDYIHYPLKGAYTITPYFPYPYYTINPTAATVIFDTANNLTATRDFCITPNGTHNDLEITFLPTWPVARPGMNASYTLVYKNRGTTTLNGTVAVNFDNNKMNFISASENVTSQSSGQLLWNYNNLQPFESKAINVTFNLLPPPVNNIGDTILYLAAITPSANDETAFDNSFVLPQRVIGSYDPNDKQCLEGSKLDIAKIGDYLHYVIRFQNEGTDTAFNIVVADTLSNNLDWSSFEFIGSSHSCNPVLKNNKAEFFFENINLPYKAINEPASNGWVAFKIKPKPSVVIGDSVNNTAAIYFDFNLPVITNKATTIVSNSSSPVPVKLEYFSANKKENSNQLNWKASCTYGNANFVIERSDDGIHFKAIGNINATAVRCQLPFNFTDNHPAAGKNYYRLKITDADGISFYSKVLVVGNNKAGVEIIAVANNVVYLNSNKQQTVTLKVITADGREVLHQKQTVGAGNNNISLQMKNAAKGIYTLIVYTEEGGIITNRFIK